MCFIVDMKQNSFFLRNVRVKHSWVLIYQVKDNSSSPCLSSLIPIHCQAIRLSNYNMTYFLLLIEMFIYILAILLGIKNN